MARLLISTAVGVGVGLATGSPQAGFAAFSATYGATGFLDPATQVRGPKLDDLKGTTASYGTPIPHVYGHPRVAGAIVWCSDKQTVEHTEEAGGKGGPSTETTTYTYKIDCRILLTANVIAGVRRIWSNGKLVWSQADDADTETLEASQETDAWEAIRVYTGAATQMPDPVEEAALGIANCPAYRGRGSVFIEGLNLGGSGYLPNLTFEVVRSGEGDSLGAHAEIPGGDYDATEHDDVILSEEELPASSFSMSCNFSISDPTSAASSPIAIIAMEDEPAVITNATVAYIAGVSPPVRGFRFFMANDDGIDWTTSIEEFGTATRSILAEYTHGSPGTMTLSIDGVVVGTKNWTADNGFSPNCTARAGQQGATFDPTVFTVTDAIFTIGTPATTLTANDEPLEDVLEDLSVRAGLDPAYLDFSSCEGKVVRALAVSQVTPSKTVMQMLGDANQQEFVEGAGLKTVARGGASVATIPFEDLGASSGDAVEPLPLKRLNDIEMPRQFAVTYQNVLNDYQNGTEYSDRLLGGSTSVATTELALGLTPQEAKRIAEVRLVDAVAGLTQIGPLAITRRYARLEPTDVITPTDHTGSAFRVRILKIINNGGQRTLEGVVDDATAINSEALTDEDYESSSVVRRLGDTEMIPIDGPLMRDVDDKPGYAVAFGASAAYRWPGAGFYDSLDDSTFTKLFDVTDRARYGTATTALPDFTGGNVIDDTSTVRVQVNGALSSVTREQLIADGSANAFLIGAHGRWEVIQAQTPTFVSEGVYDLTGLLRGQLGTEHAMGSHEVGDEVIKLQTTGLRSVDQTAADIGIARYIKAVTAGKSFGSVESEEFTPESVRLKPLAPVDLRCSRDGSGGFRITWARRPRLSSQIFATVPLGEASEAYEVDILDGDDVVRTISVTSEAADYNAAQQTADFGSVQSSIDVAVYQLSATVGRGYPLEGTLATSYSPTAQSNTITLAGTFASGVPISVYANGTLIGSRTSVGGDTNLAGIATGLAAVINGHASYSASAVGSVITVTGNPGAIYTLTAVVGGSSAISVAKTQDAALASPGEAFEAQLWISNLATGVTEPIPSGVTFSITVRVGGLTIGSFSYTTTGTTTKVGVLSQLAGALADEASLSDYSMTLDSTEYGGYFGVLYGPVGTEGVNLQITGSAPWGLSTVVQNIGSGPVAEDQPQVVQVTVTGTPGNGELFRVTLDGTPFDYTATVPSDTREEVIDGLVSAIDADADLTASQLSSTKLEASATFIGDFSYSSSITRGITATVA